MGTAIMGFTKREVQRGEANGWQHQGDWKEDLVR